MIKVNSSIAVMIYNIVSEKHRNREPDESKDPEMKKNGVWPKNSLVLYRPSVVSVSH